jgi:hypothetical protein
MDELARVRQQIYMERLQLLNAQNGRGNKPFTGFTGKVAKFESRGGDDFFLEMSVDCAAPRLALFSGISSINQFTSGDVSRTDLNALRTSLQQIGVGNSVEMSGIIFVARGLGESPEIYNDQTKYRVKILSIRKR